MYYFKLDLGLEPVYIKLFTLPSFSDRMDSFLSHVYSYCSPPIFCLVFKSFQIWKAEKQEGIVSDIFEHFTRKN